MAWIITKLSWRLLFNRLRGNVWAIVGTVFGALYGLFIIVSFFLAAIGLRITADLQLSASITVFAAAVIGIIWIIVGLVKGIDSAIEPERFALLPLTRRQLSTGILLANICSVTGITIALTLVTTWIIWSHSVITLIAAVIATPIALLLWVLLSRLVADALNGGNVDRGKKELITLVLMVTLSFGGLIVGFVSKLIADAVFNFADDPEGLVNAVHSAAGYVQWIPFASPFAFVMQVAEGNFTLAVLHLLLSGLYIVGAYVLWSRGVASRLTSPRLTAASKDIKHDSFVQRIFPLTPVGAIATRKLIYQLRDNRQRLNAIVTFLLPVALGLFYYFLGIFPANDFFVYLPLLMVLTVTSVGLLEFAYDGESLTYDIAVGVKGKTDRQGRLIALLTLYLPMAALATLIIAAVTQQWAHFVPALIVIVSFVAVGLALGLFFSPIFPGSAPSIDDSPFGKGSSGGIHSLIVMLITIIVMPLVMLPAALLILVSAGNLALIVGGCAYSVVVAVLSCLCAVHFSAKIYEARQLAVLQHISK